MRATPRPTHGLRATVAFLAVAVASVACDAGGSPPPGSPTIGPTAASPTTSDGTAPATPTPDLSGPCANAYLPVVRGARWSYERTIGPKTTPFRQTIESVGDDGFTALVDFGDAGSRELWECSAAGLTRLDQLETGPRGEPPAAGTVSFHSRRWEGVSVPADPSVGSSWTLTVTSFARFTAGGVTYTEKQVATTTFNVVGEEAVTTGAGTFDALVVETIASVRKTAPDFGAGIDQRTISHYTQWWARGVGLVRLVSSDRPINTIDLVAYRIP